MALEVIPADTIRDAWHAPLELFHKMPPLQRLGMAFEMSEASRALIVAGVKERHPDYTPDQVRMAVLKVMQGKEIFAMVYPGVDIEV